jgi:hypothetical protein
MYTFFYKTYQYIQSTPIKWVFCAFVALAIFNRVWATIHYNIPYLDIDESLMLYALHEMAHFRFHEPAFYGQSYNTVLEAFFALPLYWINLPAHIAISISSAFLAVFPFLFLAYLYYKNSLTNAAILVLVLNFASSAEYDWITGTARGFMSGVFFVSFMFPAIFKPNPKSWFLLGFGFFASVFTTPNALLVTAPLLLVLWVSEYRLVRFYFNVFLGGLLPLAYGIYRFWFYSQNADYVMHVSADMHFSIANMQMGFAMLEDLFGHVIPFFWNKGKLVFIVLLLLMFFGVHRKNWALFLFSGGTLAILILSLGVDRIYNGNLSVFFPYARSFLAFPLVLALAIRHIPIGKGALFFMALMALYLLGSKIDYTTRVQRSYTEKLDNSAEGPVYPGSTHRVEELCKTIQELEQLYATQLTFVGPGYVENHFNMVYACKALRPKMNELFSSRDRRKWLLNDLVKHTYIRVLFVTTEGHELIKPEHFGKYFPKKVNVNPDIYFVESSELEFIDNLLESGYLYY